MKGFYIVLEGPDGSGKSTQVSLLERRLQPKFNVLKVREPGSTRFGDQIRAMLLDRAYEDLSPLTELFLFSASRRHLTETLILRSLAEGKVVVSDRNYFSTEAYQGAGGKIDIEHIRYLNQIAVQDCRPDLAFIIDIPVDETMRRLDKNREKDKIESRDLDYHERVRAAYLEIAKRESAVLIDGLRTPQEIHDEIYERTKSRLCSPFKSS